MALCTMTRLADPNATELSETSIVESIQNAFQGRGGERYKCRARGGVQCSGEKKVAKTNFWTSNEAGA